jgi:hypothetical protein
MSARIAILASIVFTLLGVAPQSGLAAEPDDSDKPTAEVTDSYGDVQEEPVTFVFRGANTKVGTDSPDVYCTTGPAPRPQLVRIPGGAEIHWGAKMICTIVGTLDLSAYLQQYVNGPPYPVDNADPAPKVGYDHIAWGVYRCNGFDNRGWQVKFIPSFNGIFGWPVEGQSSVYYHNCD